MAGSIDDVLKSVGEACEIVRSTGNIDTHFYANPKSNWGKTAPYERDVMIPSDSGVVEGDLITHLSDKYLVVSVFQDRRVGEFFLNKVRLFKCNATVTVRAYSATTKEFADQETGVPCLITRSSATLMSDKGVTVPGFAGRDGGYYLYAQSVAGINKNSILTDEDGNRFRVASDIDIFFASGIVEVPVKLEAA